jgi:glycosyltransferase involved in cell wall biosynthesis
LKVAIANFSEPIEARFDYASYWAGRERPPMGPRLSLFEQPLKWGFHIHAIGVHLLDRGIANDVEYWDFSERRLLSRGPNGVLWVSFLNEDDLTTYLDRFGYPDLFINHGPCGHTTLQRLESRSFRVHVPALRREGSGTANRGAECYLVDAEDYLDERSMMYVPVVNTRRICPDGSAKLRDFVYLAAYRPEKRHDIVIAAVRGTGITGHFHPVDGSLLDLSEARITTSDWNDRHVAELLSSSTMAVYPGDNTSNPAAMWECVAAGLPIVVNADIRGGKHLVVPGVTGELATEGDFRDVMKQVLADIDFYTPREYFEEHWDTVKTIETYLDFFSRMGFRCS